MERAEYACIEVDGFAADALQGVVNETRFEQRLLSPGHFRARAQRIRFPGFSLDCGTYTLPVYANGCFGEGVLGLALALQGERIWLNGEHVHAGQLLIFTEGRELSIRPQSDLWEWAVLLISRESLQQAALVRCGRELDLPATGWVRCGYPVDGNVPLQNAIRGALRSAASWTSPMPGWETLATGQWLLDAFVDAVWKNMNPETDDLRSRSRHRREAFMKQAEAFLQATVGQEFSSAALSAALHLSERQVQRVFQEAYGMGPLRWQLVARLNHVRRALQHEPGLRVTEAASRVGLPILAASPANTARSSANVPTKPESTFPGVSKWQAAVTRGAITRSRQDV